MNKWTRIGLGQEGVDQQNTCNWRRHLTMDSFAVLCNGLTTS